MPKTYDVSRLHMSLELPQIWWRPENAKLGATFIADPEGDLKVDWRPASDDSERRGTRAQWRGRRVPAIEFSGELTKVADVSRALDAALGLDLEDDDAILTFVCTYGPMSVYTRELTTGFVNETMADVVTDEGLVGRRDPDGTFWRPHTIERDEALSDFRAAAGAIRSLVALRTNLEDWVSLQALRGSWPKDSPWESPARKSEAADNYKWAIDQALKYLTVEVDPVWPAGLAEGVARLRWCLYARCVLELLSATHVPRRCARDDCGQWFTEQRDRRTKSTKRRSDAIYCSVRCGQIVAARTWRLRNRTKPTRGR